jgi:hypothetical protein
MTSHDHVMQALIISWYNVCTLSTPGRKYTKKCKGRRNGHGIQRHFTLHGVKFNDPLKAKHIKVLFYLVFINFGKTIAFYRFPGFIHFSFE